MGVMFGNRGCFVCGSTDYPVAQSHVTGIPDFTDPSRPQELKAPFSISQNAKSKWPVARVNFPK